MRVVLSIWAFDLAGELDKVDDELDNTIKSSPWYREKGIPGWQKY
jgi:hypothetical protein